MDNDAHARRYRSATITHIWKPGLSKKLEEEAKARFLSPEIFRDRVYVPELR